MIPDSRGIGIEVSAADRERLRHSMPSGWSAGASSGRSRPMGQSRSARRQLAYMLDGIDWRNPVRTWRPGVDE
jgi:hypothetical protein